MIKVLQSGFESLELDMAAILATPIQSVLFSHVQAFHIQT